MCTFWYVWESMCIVFWKRVEIIVYILKEMEINLSFWDGWKFERIKNQCVRWRSIYSFCGNGNSHRDQRGDLPRLVDVDNVWGTKYLNFKNNQYTARWKSPKIFLFLFLGCKKSNEKGRQKCWRSFVLSLVSFQTQRSSQNQIKQKIKQT